MINLKKYHICGIPFKNMLINTFSLFIPEINKVEHVIQNRFQCQGPQTGLKSNKINDLK